MTRLKEPAELRRERILKLIEGDRFVRPTEIAETLKVSGETIRRDLLSLEQSGLLRRVHGGAIAGDVRTSEPDRASRAKLNQREKSEIAEIAVSLIGSTDALFLDVGTTVEAIARSLPASFHGTIVTNNLLVSSILGDRDGVELHVLGGKVRPGEYTTYGTDTLEQIAGFTTDLAFIGAGGVHAEYGLTDYSTEDVALKRAMIRQSRAAYITAGSEKLGRSALHRVCDLTLITGVITDRKVTKGQLDEFEASEARLLHPEA